MKNVWQDLQKPIMCLAPMAGATDTVFRQVISNLGKPDLMMTEFLCVDQLYSHGSRVIQQLLEYEKKERPIIAQIWGIEPELFRTTTEMIVNLGFDGVDINMGCPEKSVLKRGACSALIEDEPLAAEIIAATKKGAAGKIPVSVKTRIGFRKIATERWSRFLLGQDISALTVHGRTTKEMSTVPCHWDEIGKVVSIRNEMKVDTLIIGNGDIKKLEEADEMIKTYGVDGVMIGRGVFHDPYVFNPKKSINDISREEKIDLLEIHVRLYQKTWEDEKNYSPLKRFYKIYINGFPEAAIARDKLMQTTTYSEAYAAIKDLKTGF